MNIAIVVCCDARMLPAACCTLISAFRTTSETFRYFLVVEGAADVQPAVRFLASAVAPVNILRHDGASSAMGANESRFSAATLTRLHLETVLPPDLDRVLYLDSDVLVFDDLAKLVHSDLAGHSLGAVDDLAEKKAELPAERDEHKRRIGMNVSSAYFNAGVMLFDWQRVRAMGLLRRGAETYAREAARLELHDQDALNLVVDGAFQPLPPRWNHRPRAELRGSGSGIIHFIGARKPWHAEPGLRFWPYRRYYRELLAGSEWRNFVAPLSLRTRLSVLMKYRQLPI